MDTRNRTRCKDKKIGRGRSKSQHLSPVRRRLTPVSSVERLRFNKLSCKSCEKITQDVSQRKLKLRGGAAKENRNVKFSGVPMKKGRTLPVSEADVSGCCECESTAPCCGCTKDAQLCPDPRAQPEPRDREATPITIDYLPLSNYLQNKILEGGSSSKLKPLTENGVRQKVKSGQNRATADSSLSSDMYSVQGKPTNRRKPPVLAHKFGIDWISGLNDTRRRGLTCSQQQVNELAEFRKSNWSSCHSLIHSGPQHGTDEVEDVHPQQNKLTYKTRSRYSPYRCNTQHTARTSPCHVRHSARTDVHSARTDVQSARTDTQSARINTHSGRSSSSASMSPRAAVRAAHQARLKCAARKFTMEGGCS